MLTSRAGDARMFYWLDIHLTPAGNRAVAAALRPKLQELIDRQATRRAAHAAIAEPHGRPRE